jgi:hypothetical protein
MLQQAATGTFTPIGRQLDSEGTIATLVKNTALPASMRLHIPRCLRVVYDIRNKRDAAHLGDGIDPNTQDATLVVSTIDWVMAEFIRLYHRVTPDEAQQMIDDLVARRAPAVENFDGFLKVLRPELKARSYLLLILYERGSRGATFKELSDWAQPTMRKNLMRTLDQLVNQLAFVHFDRLRYHLTRLGIQQVESDKLHRA